MITYHCDRYAHYRLFYAWLIKNLKINGHGALKISLTQAWKG